MRKRQRGWAHLKLCTKVGKQSVHLTIQQNNSSILHAKIRVYLPLDLQRPRHKGEQTSVSRKRGWEGAKQQICQDNLCRQAQCGLAFFRALLNRPFHLLWLECQSTNDMSGYSTIT
jgi:hypothetical protein